MLWHAAWPPFQDRIEGRVGLRQVVVTSRAKEPRHPLLAKKLRRRRTCQLGTPRHQGVTHRCRPLLLGDRQELAREIADHFGADQPLFMICVTTRTPAAGRSCLASVTCRSCRDTEFAPFLQSLWAATSFSLGAYGRGIRYDERRA